MNADLRKRWEDLNREAYGQSTPLLEKLFDFTREVMQRMERAERSLTVALENPMNRIVLHRDLSEWIEERKPLDCEGPVLGGRGKVDIREFTARKP